MKGFDKELEQYGIFAKNGKKSIQENNITLINVDIEKVDFNILQKNKIEKLRIENSEIKNIIFAKENDINIHFTECTIKNHIFAREIDFNGIFIFLHCIFEKMVDFSCSNFNSIFSLYASKFNNEVRFVKTNFLTNQKEKIENNSENEVITNGFKEVIFLNKVYFSNLNFKSEVSFNFTRFEDMVLFEGVVFSNNKNHFSHTEFNNIKIISSTEQNVKQSYFFEHSIFKGITNFQDLKIENLEFKDTVFNNIVVFDSTILDNKPKFTNCTFSNQFNIKHDCIQYDYNELKEKSKNTYNEFLNFRDLFRKLKSNRIAHHNLINASELRTQELYARELELKHKENKNLKDTIEQWQLFFYRKLCDHHTDLILNVKWLATTITVFLCLYFFSKYGLNFQHFINEYNNNSIIKYININFIYKFESYNGFIFIFYTYILIFMLWNVFRIFFSFAVILCCIINQPKLIFGIANLIGDNSYNAFKNLLITIYTLIAGLIIFSLQKTARKNTIIPN
ncbi:hypothetical protein [Campylobacter lari]|uniref:hypothetical protein n=1 Tax=Campylobacter lari TaxID=201 RepID=UPI002149A2D6|nr:hypothetical protein [Campylobacter lari]MCR2081340.1 hypothetical protein [Campylobacter lari subsp. concheus]